MTIGHEELELSLYANADSLARRITKRAARHADLVADLTEAQLVARRAVAAALRAQADDEADLALLRQAAARQGRAR